MINELTKEQKNRFGAYRDKWLKIGLSTDRINREEGIKIIHELQEKLLKRKKTPVVFLDGPLHTWIAVCLFCSGNVKNQVKNHVKNQVVDQVGYQVWNQVGNQVIDQVGYQVWNKVRNKVWNQVWNKVGSQVEEQVWNQVCNQVESQIKNKVKNQVKNYIQPWLIGSFDAGCFSFYDYMENELGIKSDLWEKFNIWKETSKLGIIYPLNDICFVSEKPTKILMVNGRCHCEGAPAIEYADGTRVWMLNGVQVSQYLAETPCDELDIKWFNEQKNADIKAEFIRKYGIDRMCGLGKKIDDYTKYDNRLWFDSEYELIDMSPIFATIKYAPHLKMKNLTTGTLHMEGVHPDCKNLEEALNFRMNGKHKNLEVIK